MSLPKFNTLKDIDLAEIDNQILKAKKELLFLRIQKANFSKFSPHLLTHTKHQISQLMTLKRSIQLKALSKKN
jgi:large subunit ribosomal protein L29|uniref:ribosomal protein L29 n=1 Tax=Lietzensia polymorpha TaxID=2962110 RepID=UPI002181FF3E|nr:ribosomal protein L29 [Lietzensia polymorpha]UVI61225.1 ribosomal protein L29 [Lietzensia polymorpha]